MNKSNLAQDERVLQAEVKCHLCEKIKNNSFYFSTRYEQLICFGCMAEHAEWYLNHVSQYFVNVKSQEFEKTSAKSQYTKKKIGMSLRMKVYERDGFKCITCGTQKELSLDHIKPEVLGGESTIENLQTMCRSCNSRKGARYVEASN